MNFDLSSLSNLFLILTAWGGAFLAALWLSLIIWTYRDILARARDPLGRILAVLVVAILFLPGIVIYMILRPQRTIEDEYQNTLEEEALLQSIEDASICPGCNRRIKDDWIACPNCHTKLRKRCHHCGKLMDLPWNICPHCALPVPGKHRESLTLDEAMMPLMVDIGDDGGELDFNVEPLEPEVKNSKELGDKGEEKERDDLDELDLREEQ